MALWNKILETKKLNWFFSKDYGNIYFFSLCFLFVADKLNFTGLKSMEDYKRLFNLTSNNDKSLKKNLTTKVPKTTQAPKTTLTSVNLKPIKCHCTNCGFKKNYTCTSYNGCHASVRIIDGKRHDWYGCLGGGPQVGLQISCLNICMLLLILR